MNKERINISSDDIENIKVRLSLISEYQKKAIVVKQSLDFYMVELKKELSVPDGFIFDIQQMSFIKNNAVENEST